MARGGGGAVVVYYLSGRHIPHGVDMRKYAVMLDPLQVGRLRGLARRRAVEQDRDVTWACLLRQAAERFLAAEEMPAERGGKEVGR